MTKNFNYEYEFTRVDFEYSKLLGAKPCVCNKFPIFVYKDTAARNTALKCMHCDRQTDYQGSEKSAVLMWNSDKVFVAPKPKTYIITF